MAAHELLAQRLGILLMRLHDGQALDPAELAQEFGVSVRTIQRDLHVRLGPAGFVRHQGRYFPPSVASSTLSVRDVRSFADAAGIGGLFPDLRKALDAVSGTGSQRSWRVVAKPSEDSDSTARHFADLDTAISEKRMVQFSYSRPKAAACTAVVEPYRLIGSSGIWYLAARAKGRARTYALARIGSLMVLEQRFQPDPAFVQRLDADPSIWMADESLPMVLQVSPQAAPYFQRRPLLPGQSLQRIEDDGSLTLHARVGHVNEILPIVRYWIPHLKIVEPAGLQQKLAADLLAYAQS